jgi:hypothetical protein
MNGSLGPTGVNKYSPTSQGGKQATATVTYTNQQPCNTSWKINLHTDSNTSYFVTKNNRTVDLGYDGPSMTNSTLVYWCF